MRNILLTLVALIIIIGCTSRESQCGNITNLGSNSDFNYWINIDGTRHDVDFLTFNEAFIGKYICIEYD